MKPVSFEATKAEFKLAAKIAGRAVTIGKTHDFKVDYQSTSMDIIACHANGCPLDLQRLLDAPDPDFCHDVFGIARHIDRTTGVLGDCFLPRTAKPEPATV